MKRTSRMVSFLLPILCATVISGLAVTRVLAQDSSQDEVKSSPGAADRAAAEEASVVYRHARAANTAASAALKSSAIATAQQRGISASSSRQTSDEGSGDGQLRFPADLTYNGGAIVAFAESHAIFLLPNGTCPIAVCWGNPEGFLKDLGRSEFIHVADQYIGLFASDRYTVGSHTKIGYTPTPATAPLTDHDMRAIVHFVASATGNTGYGHIYHVFLPPGQDECFGPLSPAGNGACYSPDNPNNFFFCGYHSHVNFKDIGHVLYSVEPFQNVDGCNVKPGTANGQLIDSTNNTLSHELFETITDPDGSAWFNFTSVALGGAEIGDECSFFTLVPPSSFFFDPSTFKVGPHQYAVQPEYSNVDHACSVGH